MALLFLYRDMVIPIVLFLLQTQHLPLRAVSSHTTSFLSFCIFSYILPHRVKRYFRFFEVFLFFISDISPQAPPFYPIPPLFTSLEGWCHSESRLVGTEESGGRGEPAQRYLRQQGEIRFPLVLSVSKDFNGNLV